MQLLFCRLEWLDGYSFYMKFAGEAGKVSAESAPESVQSAFNTMKLDCDNWLGYYPIGYFMGYMAGGADKTA